jgi:hypothetical protein
VRQQVEVNAQGAGAVTGSDGRFTLDLQEAGRLTLTARAEGYAALSQEISVPAMGLSDLRLTLRRGGDLSGRVVDREGRAVVNAFVFATPAAEQQPLSIAMQPTLPDGTFVVRGLTEGRQTLLARTMAAVALYA